MATTNVPETYRNAVIAHVMVDGAATAIDFYAKAFGAEELFRIDGPDGRVLHAEVSVQGATMMLGDAEGPLFSAPTALGGTTVGLHVFVDDVDALAERAVAAGAELLQPAGRSVPRRSHVHPAGPLRTRLDLPYAPGRPDAA